MLKLNQSGSLLIPLAVTITLLLCSLVFAFWAFAGRQDYKNNADAKIADAVAAAETVVAVEKEAEFAELEKSPYQSYKGQTTYGSLAINFPKNWSAYINDEGRGNTPLSGYIHPNYVPAIDSEVSFALRFEVVSTTYDSVLKTFDNAAASGKVRVSAYRAPKVNEVLGSRLEGSISAKKEGVMVLLPLRDKTIKIWTEGNEYRGDFAKIMEEVTFVP